MPEDAPFKIIFHYCLTFRFRLRGLRAENLLTLSLCFLFHRIISPESLLRQVALFEGGLRVIL
jgi:hypothetical protein